MMDSIVAWHPSRADASRSSSGFPPEAGLDTGRLCFRFLPEGSLGRNLGRFDRTSRQRLAPSTTFGENAAPKRIFVPAQGSIAPGSRTVGPECPETQLELGLPSARGLRRPVHRPRTDPGAEHAMVLRSRTGGGRPRRRRSLDRPRRAASRRDVASPPQGKRGAARIKARLQYLQHWHFLDQPIADHRRRPGKRTWPILGPWLTRLMPLR
jgi:hypothetical protein